MLQTSQQLKNHDQNKQQQHAFNIIYLSTNPKTHQTSQYHPLSVTIVLKSINKHWFLLFCINNPHKDFDKKKKPLRILTIRLCILTNLVLLNSLSSSTTSPSRSWALHLCLKTVYISLHTRSLCSYKWIQWIFLMITSNVITPPIFCF